MLGSAGAQTPLSLKQVGDSLLEKNYALRLIRIEQEVSGVQNSLGAAGYYPSVNVSGSQQGSAFDTRQEFFNGDVREADGALNQALNLGVRLDWTLFNGFLVQSTKNELGMRERLAEANTILQMETELYNAASLYFEIQARERLLQTLDSALLFSGLRVELAKKQLELGKGNRLEYLQSILDLNADSSRWMQEKTAVMNLHTQLKQAMGANPATQLAIQDSLFIMPSISFVALRSEALAQNNQLRVLKIEESLSSNGIRIAQSQRYPRVSLFSEYSFLSSQNAVGILKTNRSLGPSAGIGLTYNVFNGGQVNRDVRIARLRNEQAETNLERGNYELEMALYQAYETYLLQQRLVAFEQENVGMAKENLRLAQVQLRLGSITAFQFREVQQVGLDAEARYAQALFALKESELNLMLLSGGLVRYFTTTN